MKRRILALPKKLVLVYCIKMRQKEKKNRLVNWLPRNLQASLRKIKQYQWHIPWHIFFSPRNVKFYQVFPSLDYQGFMLEKPLFKFSVA